VDFIGIVILNNCDRGMLTKRPINHVHFKCEVGVVIKNTQNGNLTTAHEAFEANI
jgi:hypothetical protein